MYSSRRILAIWSLTRRTRPLRISSPRCISLLSPLVTSRGSRLRKGRLVRLLFNVVHVFGEGREVFGLELLGIHVFAVVSVRLVLAIKPVQAVVRVVRGVELV